MSFPILKVAGWLQEPAQTDTEGMRRLEALERFAVRIVNARAMTTRATDLRAEVDGAIETLAGRIQD